MTTKALFMTAMGGALTPFGPVKTFTRTAADVLTATAHGLETGAGPFKVMNDNVDIPAGLVAAVHAETFVTGATVIATDELLVAGKTYTLIASPAADGDVDVGAADPKTMANLAAAINLDPVASATTYHPDTVPNPTVRGIQSDGAVLRVIAKTLDAALGNAITLTSPDATLTVDNATLQGGVEGTDYFIIRLTADTFSLALTKAAALAGTVVAITDAGTGIHTLVPLVETLAEALEDVVKNFLTYPGTRVLPADFNTTKFWQSAIDGTSAGDQA